MSRSHISDVPLPTKIAFPFGAGWANVGPGWLCTYWKDAATGLVFLEGLALSTPALSANTIYIVGTLPVGFRPLTERRFITYCYTGAAYELGFLIIPTNGVIQLLSTVAMSASGHITLDGCIFTAGN